MKIGYSGRSHRNTNTTTVDLKSAITIIICCVALVLQLFSLVCWGLLQPLVWQELQFHTGTFSARSGTEPPLGHSSKIPVRSYGKPSSAIGLRLHKQIHMITIYTLQVHKGFLRFLLGILNVANFAPFSTGSESPGKTVEGH